MQYIITTIIEGKKYYFKNETGFTELKKFNKKPDGVKVFENKQYAQGFSDCYSLWCDIAIDKLLSIENRVIPYIKEEIILTVEKK